MRLVHLLAAATWMGGLITLAALVVALRRAGARRELIQAAARQFARLSWLAMGVAIITGLAQVHLLHFPWSYGRLHVKMGAVATVVVLSLIHQLSARRTSATVRGVVQGLILVASVGIYIAAVRLG